MTKKEQNQEKNYEDLHEIHLKEKEQTPVPSDGLLLKNTNIKTRKTTKKKI